MSPSQVYVVRIWRCGRGSEDFRAAVRGVEQEQASLMNSAAEIAAFFLRCAELAPDESAGISRAVASAVPPPAPR